MREVGVVQVPLRVKDSTATATPPPKRERERERRVSIGNYRNASELNGKKSSISQHRLFMDYLWWAPIDRSIEAPRRGNNSSCFHLDLLR